MSFWRFLGQLLHKWYGAVAGLLGLLAIFQQLSEALGFQPIRWGGIPPSMVTLVLYLAAIGAFIYGAYLVTLQAFAEGKMLGQADIGRLGDLRFDVNVAASAGYSSRDGTRRYAIIHGVARSSSPSSVRVLGFQLEDMEGRTYEAAAIPSGLETSVGDIRFSAPAFFEPGQILILEPNRPKELAVLFVTEGSAWNKATSTGSFSIRLKDDLDRLGHSRFSCRIYP